jgi:hypothetical protein
LGRRHHRPELGSQLLSPDAAPPNKPPSRRAAAPSSACCLLQIAQGLVGKPLSSLINVFKEEQHRDSAKGEAGLLVSLGMRALEGAGDDAWRVGVRQPKEEGEGGEV